VDFILHTAGQQGPARIDRWPGPGLLMGNNHNCSL
jgi:hypothetical protein